jgi:hypothetical protein
MNINTNFDVTDDEVERHSFLLPNSIRGIICGASGCGKTNFMLNLLVNDNLEYESIHVYGKSLHQPKYQILELLGEQGDAQVTFYDDGPMAVADAPENAVMVFDDVMQENQEIIKDYYAMGRHSNVNCFYLCQNYIKVPKHLIRGNANLMIFFALGRKDQRNIYDEFCTADMDMKEFTAEFYGAWVADPFSFFVIDTTSPPNCGRYRKKFDSFYIPKKYLMSHR